VLHTCCEHKDEVRSVRWIKDCGGRSKPLLVSASSDATAVIWGISQEMGLTVLATLQGHSGPITIADGFQHRSEENTTGILIATSSVDMNVKIWKNFNSSYGTHKF
jgi:WD40 repeat protein